jgi:phasin family protein
MAKKSGETPAAVSEHVQVADAGTEAGFESTANDEVKAGPEAAPLAIAPDVPEAAVPEAAVPEAAVPEAAVPEAAVPAATVPDAVAQPAVTENDKAVADVASGEVGPAVGPKLGSVRTQADIKTGMNNMAKTVEDIFAFGQGNLEAFVKSNQIWATGVQDLSKAVAATAQAQLDHTFATVKALAAIKSVKEVVDLQTNLARASVEKVVAETGKLTDASVKLAEQAWAPINERVTLAVEKFGRAA